MLGMLVVAYWFTVLFLNIVTVIGVLLASLAIPGLSVGLMQAARNVERGQPVGIQTLYGSLRDNARTLIALGALYLCCTLGALSLSSLVDGGALLKFMLSNSRAERAMVEDADFTLSALFIMLLMTPVLMPTMPTSSAPATRQTRARSREKKYDASPNSVSLARAIASASVLKRNSGATGPKISSLASFIAGVTSARMVGS